MYDRIMDSYIDIRVGLGFRLQVKCFGSGG